MRKLCFVCLALVTILVCSRLVRSKGRSSDVVVIASTNDEDLIDKNVQINNYVPMQEGMFTFIFASDTALAAYKKYHAIFLYGTLQDEFINTMLSKDARDATANDTFTLFKLKDLWASGQTVVILAVRDRDHISQAFEKYGQLVGRTLEENYYQRIKKNYYDTGISNSMKNRLKKYGMTIDINTAWMIDSTYQKNNFIYVHTHFPDRSIFFYKEVKKLPLNGPYALAKRDSLTERYYSGDYLLKELTYVDPIEFANLHGIRLRGVWQNDSLIAGGPFISYFLTDGDTLYVLDGIVFNPGERKTDHLTRIEVIMNSFKLIRS
jgi:hypothetical protein